MRAPPASPGRGRERESPPGRLHAAGNQTRRRLALQVAAAHLNVDANLWYKALQDTARGTRLDKKNDDESWSLEFAKVLRDLNHTGLVRDATKRGRFMTAHN